MTNPTQNPAILREVLDPEKVTLVCEIHNYVAGSGTRRNLGCKKCVFVDYVYMFAKMPPEKRQEALDQFEGLVHALSEAEDEGTLDIHIYPYPKVEIEREN